MKKVLIAGAAGAMGQKAVELVNSLPDVQLTAVLAPRLAADQAAQYHLDSTVKIYHQLADIEADIADVWVDFTLPDAVYENVKFAIQHGIRPIVGTTGLTDDQEEELVKLSDQQHLGGLIAPNFGMSAEIGRAHV